MAQSSIDRTDAMYQCKQCEKRFEQPQTLALHEKHHSYKFQCGYCSRRMKTEREFLRHEATHAESTVNTYIHHTPKEPQRAVNDVVKSEEVSGNISRPPSQNSTPSSQNIRPSSQQSRPSSQKSKPSSKQTKSSSQQSRPLSQQSQISSLQSLPSSPSRPSIQQNRLASSQQSSSTYQASYEPDDDVYKKAELYDEIHKKCEELEKEIQALQSKYNLSDSEDDDNPIESIMKEPTHNTEVKDDAYEISDSELGSTSDESIVWDNNNKTVPKNWKVGRSKDSQRTRIFKSPEGFVFESRLKALEFMINGNYAENLLSLMKNNLGEEGWVNDRSCPIRWKTRKTMGPGGGKNYEYLSPVMEILPSMQEMLTFMQSHGGFNRKEIRRLEEKIDSLNPKKSNRAENVDSIKAVTDTVDKDIIKEIKKKRVDSESKENEDEILPPGWSKKRIGGAQIYVSPEGDIVHTIQQVLTAIATKKSEVNKEENSLEFKASVAEKRKFEELFAMNKKGRFDNSKTNSKSEGLTAEQLEILEDNCKKSLYPNRQKIEEICSATNLIDREVKKWFVKKAEEQARNQLKSRSRNPSKLDSPKQQENDASSALVDPHFPSKLSDELQNLSEMHLASLNEIFNRQPYPTAENFRQMSTRLDIDKHIVIKWFRQKRSEKLAESDNLKPNSESKPSHQPSVMSKDKNNIITEEQERSLQATLARTKTPSHQDYKALVIATGLNRLKIERWFNFHK